MIIRDKRGRFEKGTKYSHWKGKKLLKEHKENIGKSFNKEKCQYLGKARNCLVCGTEIFYEDRYSMSRHLWKEHNPMKNPDVVKKNNPASHFEQVNEDFRRGIYPEKWEEKRQVGFKKHDRAINEQMKNFRQQGFRVIPTGRQKDIEPDFIAIKDNKVYAIEVEMKCPNYDKYTDIKYFDDIYWILLDQASSRAKSRAVPTDSPNSNAKHG